MMRKWSLLVVALTAATSCVPNPPVHTAARQPDRAIVAARPLLQRLALKVPDDIAATPIDAAPVAGGFAARALSAAPPFLGAPRTPDDAQRAIDCLTAAVYYEARSEPVDGQRAVAQVVLNRVRDRAFPSSVCGVVYQGSQRSTGCQFSFTCDGSLYRPREPAAWDRARDVAQAALDGSVYAPVGAATYYHTRAILPWWAPSLARIGMIGSHIFYTWRGALERALAFRQTYSGSEPGTAVTVASTGQVPADDATATRVTLAGGMVVTVHHGGATAVAAEPAVDSAASPSGTVRTLNASGVRVHLGSVAPGAPRLQPALASGNQAVIVADEPDPA